MSLKKQIFPILLIALSLLGLKIKAEEEAPQKDTAYVIEFQGAIGPAISDFILDGFEEAVEQKAKIIILKMDTPGGLDTSMREIIKGILNSPIPVVTYVAPDGARAASAGTYILYASHIAAMAPATNLGAATPVSVGGLPGTEDDRDDKKEKGKKDSQEKEDLKDDKSALKAKAVNDAKAYIRSLAQKRGRNVEWAESAVAEAKSLSAEEALKINVINVVAVDTKDLLKQINGKEVEVLDSKVTLNTENLNLAFAKPTWKYKVLKILSDPNLAYILFMLGFYGLIYELINPGFFLPGVLGGICFLLGLYALHILPVNYTGIALILLGIGLMVGEAFVPSFGILGIGGVVSLIVGSLMLFEGGQIPEFQLSRSLILTFAGVTGVTFAIIVSLAIRGQRKKQVIGGETLIGMQGEALQDLAPKGQIRLQGEIWEAHSKEKINKGSPVKVISRQGLNLLVEGLKEKDPNT